MYVNSAYLHGHRPDFKDKSRPLIVGSCGTYRLYNRPRLPSYRPRGRVDYQLLYIAQGKAHFFFKEGEDTVVTAGTMVLYRPREMQRYVYYGEDKTEVFWVHFTGSRVKLILRGFGFPEKEHLIHTGVSREYKDIYRKMIRELQMCRPHYEEYLTYLLTELFILVERHPTETVRLTSYAEDEMEAAADHFTQYYNRDINIAEYAARHGMSTSWFIRNFKLVCGMTPMQYVLSVRISNAQYLLETTSYGIGEIAQIVGYDDALYFSRFFKKHVGITPTEYRKGSRPSQYDKAGPG